jgi:8-hydroxy-5-deazaflavin:NADPH oxidoreductase
MRIAVIGTGHIGGTLGGKWQAAGYDVVYGGRSPGADGPGGARVVTIADALADADIVVFAVPGPAVADIAAANAAALDGKVVIDATNRMGQAEANNQAAIKSAAPGANYARAFNTLGWENFAEPPAGADLFFAADKSARSATEELIGAVGLEPVFVGDGSAVGTVDGVARLWFALMQQSGNRKLAFRVVR